MIRKHIVVLGTALALVAAREATAQTPAPADTARRQGEVRASQRVRGEKMRGAGLKGLFRGIDLTQAQRDQMKTVKEKYRGQFQTLRESLKPDLKAVREARQRGDTVAAGAAWDRTNTGRERMRALMEQQQNEVRGLLTAEQQQTFDRNAQQMRERMEKRGPRQRGPKSF
jgi:Spy/CpxP family protein refolding chaperone